MTRSDIPPEKKPSRFSTIIRYLKGYRKYLIFGGIAVILANGLLLINPYILKIVFDRLEKHAPSSEIFTFVAIMLGLSLIAGFFRFMMRRTIIWMSRRIEYDLRNALFEHLLKLSPSFYDRTRTGDIMARSTNDLEAVRMMIGPGIMQISNTIVTVITAMIFMIILSPKLTLYAVAPMIVVPVVVNRLGNLVHKKFIRIQEHFSTLTAVAQENLAGIRVVKAYRQEQEEIKHFAGISTEYVHLNLNMARLYGIMFPLLAFVASLLNLTVLYFGGSSVLHGQIPLGTMVAFFAYLNMLFWPVLAGGWVISLYQQGTASLDRINKILFTEPEIRNQVDKPYHGKMKGEIRFDNLTFGFSPEKAVLNNISLTISPEQTLGIVGAVGSGKTVLVSLISRLYQVPKGQLYIDGIDINEWDLLSLRKQVGFATQEPFLFSDTLSENIRFGDDDIPFDQIEASAEIAALTKDISLFPGGYETVVGERGITLSGGQKQRTAMARAVAIKPAIVILDDVTSAVDTETEDQINERMKGILGKHTTIIISHRISSVKEADIIIYLENGQIVERGNHDELVKLGGQYSDLYQSQLLAMELEKL